MSRARRRQRLRNEPLPLSQPLASLWALRMVVDLGGARQLGGFQDDEVIAIGGLDLPQASTHKLAGQQQLFEACEARLGELESAHPAVRDPLARNLDALARQLNLTELERGILTFVTFLKTSRSFDSVVDMLGRREADSAVQVIAELLDADAVDVQRALSRDARLARSGLLTIDHASRGDFSSIFEPLNGLPRLLMDPTIGEGDILRAFFDTTRPPTLTLEDFPALARELRIIEAFLAGALRHGDRGVNVLLHGPPGTGKTELAGVLAAAVDGTLFSVSLADRSGDPLAGRGRFKAFQLAQKTLARRQGTLVLFDEIEDVFPREQVFFDANGTSSGMKAWVNRTLEENEVPAIWISNAIEQIDHAYLRRFDYVLDVGVPPRAVREGILRSRLAAFELSDAWFERVSHSDDLAPAMITRAARVAERALVEDGEALQPADLLERQMNATLVAFGRSPLEAEDPAWSPPWSPDLLNCDRDLEALTRGLAGRRSGRLLLYGAPGTGKSAFARHVARHLELPLIERRASDLLSPWVGVTEHRIRDAFREAERLEAVLLVDEIDSFLRDRSSRSHGWEVTQTNELLVCMERFRGILLCTTNLVDELDAAAARRFDARIRFGTLRPEQAARLFERVFRECSGAAGQRSRRGLKDCLKAVQTLNGLTGGDFAAALRRLQLESERIEPAALLAELREELRFRQRGHHPVIGFAAEG